MTKTYIKNHLLELELKYDLIIEKTKRGYIAVMDDGYIINGLDNIICVVKELAAFEENEKED